MNLENNWRKWFPVFIMGVLLIICYKTLDNIAELGEAINHFFSIVSPFLLSVLIVYFLYIPCKKLEEFFKKSKVQWVSKGARGIGVGIVYLVIVILIGLFITFVLPVLALSILDLIGSIPDYLRALVNLVNKLPDYSFLENFDIKENLNNFVNNSLNILLDPTRVDRFMNGIFGFVSGIFDLIISLVVSLYILLDRENIKAFFENLGQTLFKPKTNNKIKRYLVQVNKVLFTFIGSKGIDSMINIVVITSLMLLFNVKYGFLLGIMCGAANFIPYLGTLIAVIIAGAITFITGGLAQALTILLALIIFQQIDANFIEPKIMGSTLKISPLIVILSVIIGGAYFGLFGMFLGVPIATILKQIILEYIESKKMEESITIV